MSRKSEVFTPKNQGDDHKYFTIMLNMAEDDLDPFDYRLLAHFVRWAGIGGQKEESLRQMADATKMSVNRVQKSLDSLTELGYIVVSTPTEAQRKKRKATVIAILDRWQDNIMRYSTVSNMTHSEDDTVSDLIQSDDSTVSNMIQLEEQVQEELKDYAPAKQARKRNPYFDALTEAFGVDIADNKTAASAFGKAARDIKASGVTPEQIPELHAFVQNKARRDKWADFTVIALAKYAPDYIAAKEKAQATPAPARPKTIEERDAEVRAQMDAVRNRPQIIDSGVGHD